MKRAIVFSILSLFLPLFGSTNRTAAADSLAVRVDPRKVVGYFSPLVYGMDCESLLDQLSSQDADALLAELSAHGVRLIRIHVNSQQGADSDRAGISDLLKSARRYGLVALITFDESDERGAVASDIANALRELADQGLQTPWIQLPPQLSKEVIMAGHVSDMPGMGALTTAGCFLSLNALNGAHPVVDTDSGTSLGLDRLQTSSQMRFGIALNGPEDLTDALVGTVATLNHHRKEEGRLSPLGVFCPWEISANTGGQLDPGVVARVADFLISLPLKGVGYAAVIPPPMTEGWRTVAAAMQLLSDWGDISGLLIATSIAAPLKGCAAKSPGELALCLINGDIQDHTARVRWVLDPGMYAVESRAFVGTEGYPRSARHGVPLSVVPEQGAPEQDIVVPAGGFVVVRCRNEGYLAYRGFHPLFDLLQGEAAARVPSPKRSLLIQILSEARRSTEATMQTGSRKPTQCARSAHRALLRLAQAEAMLKNFALQGTISRADYSSSIGVLEEITRHLSAASSLVMGIRFETSCSSTAVEPGAPFGVDVKIANLGTTAVKNVRFFCETDENLAVCQPDRDIGFRYLRPGQSASTRVQCRTHRAGPTQISVSVNLGVTYHVFQSYASLLREVEVGLK